MVQDRGERDSGGGRPEDGSDGRPGRPRDGRTPPASAVTPAARLDVSLKGTLPCVQCGYELQGVSILGVCPECGTAVRATLLAVVDPLAAELQPIRRPRMVAAGLLLWIGAMCLAALLVLYRIIQQVLAAWTLGEATPAPAWLPWVLAALILAAGAGALMIARPHDRVPPRETVLARLGAGMHAPLAAAALMVGTLHTAGWGQRSGSTVIGPLAVLWEPAPDRTTWRLVAGAAGIASIALLRPVTRALVARSLAIRTGRVDRQTLLATGAAVIVVMLGDGLGLIGRSATGPAADWVLLAAVTVLAFGALLLLIGVFSSLVDSVRIARAIVRPGPSMHQVVHGSPLRRPGDS